jgi:hypothetical protein
VRRGAVLAALLAAVGGAVSTPAGAQDVDTTCALAIARSSPAVANVAFPDEAAIYYLGAYVAVPGLRLRIHGRFPHARYMSFNLYDLEARPIDALADVELNPDPGSSNPFAPGADRTGEARDYTVFVDFGAPPATRAPNTVYAGAGQGGTPNIAGLLIYRIYLPDAGRNDTGDVGLPTVTLQTANGGPAPRSACADLQRQSVPKALNDGIAASNGLPIPEVGEVPGTNPPRWAKFTSLPRTVTDALFVNPYADAFRALADTLPIDQLGGAGGFLSNTHNAYMTTATNRSRGRVLITRMRAPTFADTRPGPSRMPTAQLRYFSFCQNEIATQRFIACVTDDRTAVGRDGYMTFAVSTPADRPANATAACGVTWLPWGPVQEGILIYRHMLPDPGFGQAIQRTARLQEAKVMGEYLPVSRYYAGKADFEALGCAAAAPASVPASPGCRAVAPVTTLSRLQLRRRTARLGGTARAFACTGSARITQVRMSVHTRAVRGRCRHRRCTKVNWLVTRVRGNGWSFAHSSRLIAGRYAVAVRARDGAGRGSRTAERTALVR